MTSVTLYLPSGPASIQAKHFGQHASFNYYFTQLWTTFINLFHNAFPGWLWICVLTIRNAIYTVTLSTLIYIFSYMSALYLLSPQALTQIILKLKIWALSIVSFLATLSTLHSLIGWWLIADWSSLFHRAFYWRALIVTWIPVLLYFSQRWTLNTDPPLLCEGWWLIGLCSPIKHLPETLLI